MGQAAAANAKRKDEEISNQSSSKLIFMEQVLLPANHSFQDKKLLSFISRFKQNSFTYATAKQPLLKVTVQLAIRNFRLLCLILACSGNKN